LRDVVDYYGTVGISVVHGRQGLVPFLACGIPDLELDCGVLVQGDGLCEEGRTDCGFSIRVKLVLKSGKPR